MRLCAAVLRLLDVGTEYAADDDGAFCLIDLFGDDGDEEFKRVRGWVQFIDSPVALRRPGLRRPPPRRTPHQRLGRSS